MNSAMFKIVHKVQQSPITKLWDVVLYSGTAPIGSNGIRVYRICCKESTMQPINTTGILHVDEIDNGVSMINTDPFRYIALNTAKYNSDKSSTIVVYTTEAPVEGNLLSANMLCIGGHAPTGFIPTTLEIENCKKLSSNLYSMRTDDKTYFIVVE